jgi:hypothetical protein
MAVRTVYITHYIMGQRVIVCGRDQNDARLVETLWQISMLGDNLMIPLLGSSAKFLFKKVTISLVDNTKRGCYY